MSYDDDYLSDDEPFQDDDLDPDALPEISRAELEQRLRLARAAFVPFDLTRYRLARRECYAGLDLGELSAPEFDFTAGTSDTACEGNWPPLLTNVRLNSGQFPGALFTNCSLDGADLEEGNFSCADFREATLTGVYANRANFYRATFARWVFGRTTLDYAWLLGAYLVGADLSQASLRHAHLVGAMFDEADLTDADLTGADCTGASFRHAILVGTRFDGATIAGANFTGAVFVSEEDEEGVQGRSQDRNQHAPRPAWVMTWERPVPIVPVLPDEPPFLESSESFYEREVETPGYVYSEGDADPYGGGGYLTKSEEENPFLPLYDEE
jgi:uncharacterized protein YjbI with pentapeptide repeats